jgi:hypothetical protein
MSRAKVLGAALVLVGAIATAGPAAAQVTVGTDVALFSSYVWRGVTYTNKFVVEPDVYLTFPAGKASITAGGWANIEPSAYDGAEDISENGTEGAGLTEFDWWGELSFPVGPATLTGGVTGYIFPNDAGFTSDANTVEIYGKVAFAGPLSPKLAVWYDVDNIKGAYFEGSVAHSVPLGAASLNFGLLAGVSAGQGCELTGAKVYPDDCTATPSYNFAEDGLTHLDLSAAIPFSAGPLTIAPSVHALYLQTTNAKFTNAVNSNDFKGWLGVTISWSKALGGAEEAAAEAEPAAE